MRTWLGSLLFVVLGTFALASGCGTPEVIRNGDNLHPDASVGGDGNDDDAGTAATGAGLHVGEGGDNSMGCPSTCADLNADCGFVTDTRCNGLIECGDSCPAGQICGGDGPNRCGAGMTGDAGSCSGPGCQACVPKTCEDLGFTCGPAGDTCGGKLECGSNTCPVLGWTCGGGGKLGECGCTGACSDIPDCSAQPSKTTTLTGKVYDPAGNNPLYHVFVYVANNPDDPALKSFPVGVTCDVCGATAAGSPLLSEGDQFGTYTDVDGSFVLKNVPAGKAVTVVIQLGRWRRVFQLDIDQPCAANAVPDKTLLMPSKQSQGNIPLMAMVTGNADSLECVLRKMGIDDSEFTNPAGGGRVQFYLGTGDTDTNGNYGQIIDKTTPKQSALFASGADGQPLINGYDMTVLACQGSAYAQSSAAQAALRSYAAAGGRVFTSHYSYAWLSKNDANTAQVGLSDNWSEVAKWKADENDRAEHSTGHIDLLSNPKGGAFQGWLEAVNASTPGSGTISVDVVRHDVDGISDVPGQTQQWLSRDCSEKFCSVNSSAACSTTAPCGTVCRNKVGFPSCLQNADCGGNNNCVAQTCLDACSATYAGKTLPLHFTYNTPVNLVQDLNADPPALQCGRVLFSDFHVQDAQEHDKVFPAQCNKLPMTPQEKLLEFMIFDLGSCVPPPKACVPAAECPVGANCGYAPDGCGGLVACGECAKGEACGVGNPPVPNKCGKGTQTCVPMTCAAQKKECGPAGDGCGDKIDSCGTCDSGELCVQGKCIHIN